MRPTSPSRLSQAIDSAMIDQGFDALYKRIHRLKFETFPVFAILLAYFDRVLPTGRQHPSYPIVVRNFAKRKGLSSKSAEQEIERIHEVTVEHGAIEALEDFSFYILPSIYGAFRLQLDESSARAFRLLISQSKRQRDGLFEGQDYDGLIANIARRERDSLRRRMRARGRGRPPVDLVAFRDEFERTVKICREAGSSRPSHDSELLLAERHHISVDAVRTRLKRARQLAKRSSDSSTT